MEASLGPLLPLYERERAAGRALVLGVLMRVAGSTYRKPGALMLIAASGEYAGLLSGGCLEGDLGEHARGVIASGEPRVVSYDTRGPEDLLWGLGLGCEGAMDILLLRVGPGELWQPLEHLASAQAARSPTAVGVVVESSRAELPAGSLALLAAAAAPVLRAPAVQSALERSRANGEVAWVEDERGAWRLFVLPLALPARILILGAGPDAAPVAELAARVGWKVTLADHRPAYAAAHRFPSAERVIALPGADALAAETDLGGYDAAVVMSHHLRSDLVYLRALAAAPIAYVGLLGPVARRDKLLAELGAEAAAALGSRLHAPVGLPLGGRAPESIALAIVAEIHAFLHGSVGRAEPASAEATA